MEGVAYGLRDCLEVVQELGCDVVAGRASGGGARSDLWLRIVASVLGMPLQRTVVEEGAAYGAALLDGVAAGVFSDVREAVEACVRVRDEVEPVSEWASRYAEGYERFCALYPALREAT
jgi:xylulokinase